MSSRADQQTIVAVDIGGTNARFSLARVTAGQPPVLGETVTMKTADHASLVTAWEAFTGELGEEVPSAASICIAAPLTSDVIKLTNSPWVITQSTLARDLGLDKVMLLNDFGAMAHAVANMSESAFEHVSGPDVPIPEEGVTTVVGPGTGFGVAQLIRRGGKIIVVETEGGHTDYAPLDTVETAIVNRLRDKYLRVSVERLVSGPGLSNIHEALAAIEGRSYQPIGDAELWAAATEGKDLLAAAALKRFCLSLGAVSGDLALTHGASGVVLIGGLAQRIKHKLRDSEFSVRFCAKGRFESLMKTIPVRVAIHPQPGLLGSAAAFSAQL
ncbi:MAG: glucokinase [Xanthomonadales bacterium]|nr:glucokinase [Xanthomonadales bacterium]